jgi:hypothetical protein
MLQIREIIHWTIHTPLKSCKVSGFGVILQSGIKTQLIHNSLAKDPISLLKQNVNSILHLILLQLK